MGWEMPWYTITDSFDADFGVDEWHGHNVFFRDDERVRGMPWDWISSRTALNAESYFISVVSQHSWIQFEIRKPSIGNLRAIVSALPRQHHCQLKTGRCRYRRFRGRTKRSRWLRYALLIKQKQERRRLVPSEHR
jgi:Bacterial protein of unknown function (DUF899)